MAEYKECVICGQYTSDDRSVCPNCERRDPSLETIKVEILIDKIVDVAEFVQLVTKCPSEVVVSSGNYRVNGKSLLGLYSLDLSKEVMVEFYGDVPYEVQEGMKEFIVK